MRPIGILPLLVLCLLLSACQQDNPNTVFTKLSKRTTGIDFRNMLVENEDFNIFKYQYFNNGGGVAVGDFNNDGLQDLVFTGNMVKNRLYINEGNFSFKDVTQKSGIAEKEGWCTGVTTVDINEDGWLDLYICRAAYPFKKLRRNLLFINNGDLTFTEKAADYGLDDLAFSTHSAFFDYDKDGDLDLFLINHSTVEYSKGSLEVVQLRKKKNPDFTNKFFRNDNGKFVNVTDETGITSNVLTFSLGLSISDINNDGWADIFVGNDFNEPDYLFINQQDGTFEDELAKRFDHTSMFSMGSDIADFNNDGWLDLVSLDMLPESNYAQKMHSGADNFDKVALLIKKGFFKQYSRNMLQLNKGNGTFTEIGQFADVSNTDWSWAPLFFDFDNDGHKDLFIANGYPRDHTDMDFLNFTANEVLKIDKGEDHVNFEEYVAQMPAILEPNYFYKNNGNLQFENKTKDWGLDEPVVSQSATYADLDNDGDLDLILNNTGTYADIYENNSNQLFGNNYLKIKLTGRKANSDGIGAKVYLYADGKVFYQEQYPVRGFQSTVDPVLNFGLGEIEKIDTIKIVWATDEQQILQNIEPNQTLEVEIKQALKKAQKSAVATAAFFKTRKIPDLKHQENNFNDLKIQSLLPWFFSRQGPAMAVADINNDGREDVFLGSAKGDAGQVLIQNGSPVFSRKTDFLKKDASKEDTDALFFDADMDGDMDLYVASGSYEIETEKDLEDRLYLNNGKGVFTASTSNLPKQRMNTTCVADADIDGDGDQDLFVGGGYIHGQYPECYPGHILLNDGKGHFEKQKIDAPVHHVNDATWTDLDGDKIPELIVVGEWSPIRVFETKDGKLTDHTMKYFDDYYTGMWNTVYTADFDGDGDQDIVAGNLGLNSQLTASTDEPLELYAGDFDDNGSIDPLLCYYVDGQSYPFVSRDDMIAQLPHLKKKFLFFKDYANAQIEQILTAEQLEKAKEYKAITLETSYFENTGIGFEKRPLPVEAQVAPVYAIQSLDVNHDGNLDLVMAGNMTNARVKLGRLDGNHGQVFLGDGQGDFRLASATKTGLNLRGEVRQIEPIKMNKRTHLLWGVNNNNFKMSTLKATKQ